MKHEAITVLTGQCINLLFITCRTQSSDYECLSFTARKQGRAVSTWQHTGTNSNWAHSTRIAAIDTWLTVENLRANDFGFEIEHHVTNVG